MKHLLILTALALATSTACGALRSITPAPRDPNPKGWWMQRHAEKMAVITNGGSKVVFIGDSITHGWEGAGRVQWQKYFAGEPYKALNIGYSADRTEHVLWRLTQLGELDGYEAKCVLLMIGTNNTGHHKFRDEPPIDTILGIRKILQVIREKQPKAKIVLMPIFPRENEDMGEICAKRNAIINKEICTFADGKTIFWVDFNDQFLTLEGRLPRELFPDGLHPGARGYEIWYSAVKPYIDYALSDGKLPAPANRYAPFLRAENVRVDTSIATYPDSRIDGMDGWWIGRMLERRNQIADSKGEIDLVFFGDSITHYWDGAGRPALEELRKTYTVLNIGYSGDHTEHLLWRGENGELDGYKAKCIMLMIGTNNTWHRKDNPVDIAAGIKAILEMIARKQPQATTLLLPIFPFGDGPQHPNRVNNETVNALIKPYADGKKVIWVDFNEKFLDEKGDVVKWMGDRCHPNAAGYSEVWLPSVLPYFKKIVGKAPVSLLPPESKEHPALAPNPFPDRISAYVWRNWGLVPTARLAEVVGATAADLTALAADFGLKPNPEVLPEWRRKGYITIVRRNWHLLTSDQIARLVDKSDEEFAFSLKEDDFLFGKLGGFKPGCEPLVWDAKAAAASRGARQAIAKTIASEGIDPNAAEEPRFTFIREMSATSAAPQPPASTASQSSSFSFRMIASYFADYGDPLGNDEISSFPEGLLQKLAANGVNAVWMHVVLNQLTTDPKYPEFGKGSARRVANLKKLVARAAKYGIKVYLYMNEPRCVSTDFFANHKDIQGVREDAGVSAMCTSVPETRRWLRDALKQLFSNVKGLGGVFTITMSENLTNCASHGQKEKCPRCKDRSVADILAEVHATIVEGVTAGDPSAEVLAWNWVWPKEDEQTIVAKLPKTGCRVMGVSENGIPVTIGGVTIPEVDYSLALVGPGENARRLWGAARARGLPCVAKVQANNSWELSSFPYLPLADLVWEHAENLRKEGVSGVMLSWSCGSAPAPNLRLFNGVSPEALATDLYGAKAVPAVRRAWKAFADGFRRYPFEVVVLYKGPQQWGPANPLYAKPTGYEATMVGTPYDGLDFGSWDNKWHGRFPLKDWLARFEEVADGFEKGSRLFDEALALVAPEKRAAAEKESRMFRAEAMHFRSVVDQSRFILARDVGDRAGMRKYAQRELAAAKAYLPLVRDDSRIGYECSNHYFYIPRDVIEKIVGCRQILTALEK